MTHGHSPMGSAPIQWTRETALPPQLCCLDARRLGGVAGLPDVLLSHLEKGKNGCCPLVSEKLLQMPLRRNSE